MSDNDEGAQGFLDQSTTASEYNSFFFKVMGILAQNNFNVVVEVMAVQSAGELALAGVIDVRPLVNQYRPDGVAIPHETIHGVSYLRMQGGTDAVIMDPVVGDKGIMMCADKDISSVKANRGVANPGSFREHDYADGVYMGGFLNAVPTQYVRFSSSGIEMVSPTKIRGVAPIIEWVATDKITSTATNSITETAPQIIENASISISQSTATFTLAATTSAGITSPLTTITGLATITGLTTLGGGFAASPRVGGSASTISGDLSLTSGNVSFSGALSVGGATTLAGVTAGGKDIGGTHKHSGVQTGGGTSGGPI
jgi:hypothetical protein